MSTGSTNASIAEPASQHALALPEVLSAIFSCIDDDEFDPAAGILCDRAAILSRCCRVNRLWYAEASRQLAEEHALRGVIDPFDPEHLSALAEIRDEPPGQRQRHANLLKLVTLSNIRDPASASAPEDPTYSLAFPRVKALHLRLDDHLAANGQGWHIPPLGPSRIELLELDPRYERNPEAFGLTPNDWEDILEQIPVCTVPTCLHPIHYVGNQESIPTSWSSPFLDLPLLP